MFAQQRLDAVGAEPPTWVAFIGLVSAVMSWMASYIIPISKYGVGAVVFAGIGVACAITLVASGALVAWRYFNPLRPVAPSEGQKAQGSESHALVFRSHQRIPKSG